MIYPVDSIIHFFYNWSLKPILMLLIKAVYLPIVFSKVNSFAGIDYSIIEEPIFRDEYMDVPLKVNKTKKVNERA